MVTGENEESVLPVVVDTLPARDLKVAYINEEVYNTPSSLYQPHLLSPEHKRKMKELPY